MKKILTGLYLFAPALVFAQNPDLSDINSFVDAIGDIVGAAIPIVFALALLFFFWGLAKYILAAGNEEAKDEGKRIMVWGIVALFVMASVWGLVEFLQDLFGIDESAGVNTPDIPE